MMISKNWNEFKKHFQTAFKQKIIDEGILLTQSVKSKVIPVENQKSLFDNENNFDKKVSLALKKGKYKTQ